MSTFWQLKLLKKDSNAVQIRVWAIYKDCQRFPFTKDWMLLALYEIGDAVSDYFDELYIQQQLAEDSDLTREQAYCMDDLDATYPEIVAQTIEYIDISAIQNLTPTADFFASSYRYHNPMGEYLPNCLYTVTLKDAGLLDILQEGTEWQSCCFDFKSNDKTEKARWLDTLTIVKT